MAALLTAVRFIGDHDRADRGRVLSYYFAPPAGRTNYGTLLQPQRPVPALSLTNLDGTRFDLRQLAGNWVFVMVDGGQCDKPAQISC